MSLYRDSIRRLRSLSDTLFTKLRGEDRGFQIEGKLDKKREFLEVLELSIQITFTASIVMGALHHISGAEGSAI